jgi:hypothetical protein
VVTGSRSPHRYRLIDGVAMRRRLKTIETGVAGAIRGKAV